MSIEPTCQFCGLVDKARCRTADEAEDCRHAPVEGKGPEVRTGALTGLRRGHYGVIYADPPWTFLTRSDKGKDRSPEQHYKTMSLDDIMDMPVGEIAAKDSVLFMWMIDTHIQAALDVIGSWGFTYKTVGLHWCKTQAKVAEYPIEKRDVLTDSPFFTGMGFWTRANPEMCLLATKGSPKRLSGAVRRLLVSPRREHSRKPDEAYERIEALVPGPYVELFSRSNRVGWDAMGNEVGKFDKRLLTPEEDAEIEALL